jgi:hypothetical protein
MDAPLSDDDDDEMKRDRERAIKRPAWLHETSRYSNGDEKRTEPPPSSSGSVLTGEKPINSGNPSCDATAAQEAEYTEASD